MIPLRTKKYYITVIFDKLHTWGMHALPMLTCKLSF